MRTIAIINLKGGVAKTTSSINIAYLVTFKYGIKVCMVGYGSCKRTVLGYPIGHGWYSLEEAQYYAKDGIIAWMPLPEPYKEDD